MVVMSKSSLEVQSVGELAKKGARTEPEETDAETVTCQAEDDPVARLASTLKTVMLASEVEGDAVYFHEGVDYMSLNVLREQLAVLPDLTGEAKEVKIQDADVGEPGETTPEMEGHLREIGSRHQSIFLGDGNALPPPARGVVCDLNVGDAEPIAQRLDLWLRTCCRKCMSY
jgi:hypothetical protein